MGEEPLVEREAGRSRRRSKLHNNNMQPGRGAHLLYHQVAQQQHAARRRCTPAIMTHTLEVPPLLGLSFKELTSEGLELAQQGGAWLLHRRKECLSQVAREKVKGESERKK